MSNKLEALFKQRDEIVHQMRADPTIHRMSDFPAHFDAMQRYYARLAQVENKIVAAGGVV